MRDHRVSIGGWLLVAFLALPATAAEVALYDFDDGTTQGWTAVGADDLATDQPGPSGLPGDRFLHFGDRSNVDANDALRLFAPDEVVDSLHGVASTCGTLELDFRVIEDNDQPVPFTIRLELDADGFATGSPPTIVAIFRPAQPITEASGWVHLVVPLSLGGPPSNASGAWEMAAGSSPAQWDALLLGADLLSMPLDLSGQSEEYGVDNVRLVTGACETPPESCLVPPRDLAVWFPLDEPEGLGGIADIAGRTIGRRLGDRGAGPGTVGGALAFDGDGDWVDGENTPLLDFAAGQDFSIDFWIRTQDDQGLSILLEKRDFSGAPLGWQVYLSNGSPGLQLATGSGSAICSSDASSACTNYTAPFGVADGTWHLVAVTVDRDHPQGIHWYLDGQQVGPASNPTPRNGDLSNDHGVRIAAGSDQGSNAPFGHFTGELDEIEIFRRALTPLEVQRIDLATGGKCDTSLVVPWDRSIECDTVEITLCNHDARNEETYDLGATPLPAGTLAHPTFACSVDGPTQFTPIAPATPTVRVPPGACTEIEVEIGFAPGAARGYGCYEVTATPRSGGRVLRRAGSVVVPQNVCVRGGGVTSVPPFGVGETEFVAVNLTPSPRVFRYALDVVDADMEPDDSAVSLDGQEPGATVEGEVALAPGETAPIQVPVALTGFDPFNGYEVLLRDRDLAPPVDVLSSQVVRSVGTGGCLEDDLRLCLAADRFEVSVAWQDFQGGSGVGQALPLTADTGMFWFFQPANIELVVKVLDARAVNGHFWVFYGALSNVGYTIHVRDTATGATRTYVNPSRTFGSRGDTSAFPDTGGPAAAVLRGDQLTSLGDGGAGSWGLVQIPAGEAGGFAGAPRSIAGSQGTCVADATSFCLHDARFRVRSEWATTQGTSGEGRPIPLTSDTGAFWFFDAANVELVVKIIDGRSVNGNWWVFYGSLSNVAFEVEIEDTERGRTLTLANPQGNFGSRGETDLLPAP